MSNVIKGNFGYSFRDESTKVIDTNQKMAEKLEELSNLVQQQARQSDEFKEDFTQGLEALQVERLLMDGDADPGDGSNVIKGPAEPAPDEAELRQRADEILEQARAEAEEILEQARTDADSIRSSAQAEGERAGYDAGFENGQREGMASLDEQRRAIEQEKFRLEESYEEQISALEPKFVEVFTEVYEHVFHVKLSDSKEIIFYLIQNALRKAENNKNFIIHVSKDDYGFVSMQKKELLAGIAGSESAEIVEDMTLKANECFIDTGGGIFDCSLETQLEGLKRELRLLSYSPSGSIE
ncbi:MAG: hypothetical protein IKR68_06345 [Lachnospiraceae bacterium]|nr:hypothetical protein [Lachnospiraceae bacterium]